jgi:hypothetical protein
MRRLTAWIGGVASGVIAYRFWRRHQQAAAEPAPTEPDDRAEELRMKLAESRETVAAEPEIKEPPAAAQAEPVAETAVEDPSESPEERRQRVHDEGRATLDEMKSD